MKRTAYILIATGVSATLCASVSSAGVGKPPGTFCKERRATLSMRQESTRDGEQLQGAIIMGPVMWSSGGDAEEKTKQISTDLREITADSLITDFAAGRTEFAGHVVIDTTAYEIRATKAIVFLHPKEPAIRVIRLTGDVKVLDRKTARVRTYGELELTPGEEDKKPNKTSPADR